MDTTILKKRLNTFKSSSGRINRVSDEVILEVLHGWEQWPGKSIDFYKELGLSKQQLATFIKKGKALVKSGIIREGDFHELKLESSVSSSPVSCQSSIVLKWDTGKLIRFPEVDQLVDFLKKVS